MDLNAILKRLSRGDMVVGIALAVAFINSFIGWWFRASYSAFGVSESATGGSMWESWGIFAALVMLALIGFYVLRVFLAEAVKLPALPLKDAFVFMGGGALMVLLLVLDWLANSASSTDSFFGVTSSAGPWIGWIIGLLATLAIIGGGFLKMNDPAPVAAAPGSFGNFMAPPPGPPMGGPPAGTPPMSPPPSTPPPATPPAG